MRFLVGIIGIPLGFIMIVYRKKLHDITGSMAWAEKYLGQGGTFTALALIGLAVSALSLMYMLGTLQTLLYNALGRFFVGG